MVQLMFAVTRVVIYTCTNDTMISVYGPEYVSMLIYITYVYIQDTCS